MREQTKCRTCGVELTEDAAEGLCPKCVLLDGLAHDTVRVTVNDARPIESEGSEIGRYKVLEKIGEGGMAVVYMAEQKRPIRRKVALKIIKLGMDTRQVIARFEAERQALAMMDHPHIAKVFDAGTTTTGRPYFVMELVRGVTITEFCDKSKLNTRERLLLFLQVCEAVQHAHQKGIIHRDLKPSNILVTLHEGNHVAVIIDFGIAKATSHQLTEKTLFTQYAQLIGTPEYMSPEQAEMSRLDVDTRADIYSLGVLLYELLTGTTPFDSKTLREAGYAKMQQIIRDSEPPKPSTRLSNLGVTLDTTASLRRTRPESLCSAVRGDLDWIVMKSMDKDRNQRYETANGLAMDIQRHLENEPILARPPSALYRFQKMIKKNKLVVGASTAVVAALVVGLTVSIFMFLRERDAYLQMVQSKTLETEQRTRAERNERQARLHLYAADMKLASTALAEGHLTWGRNLLDRHRPQPEQDDLRGFEWRYLWGQLQSAELVSFDDGHCNALAYSPDGRFLVSSAPGGTRVRDAESLSLITRLSRSAMTLSFSASGQRLAVGSEGGVVVFDTNAWKEVSSIESADYPAAYSANGRWLTTNTKPEGAFQRLDMQTGNVIETYDTRPGLQIQSRHILDFSADGRWMVTPAEGPNGTDWIRLWSLTNGTEVTIDRFGSYPTSAEFSPDTRHLFIGAWDGTLVAWDLAEHRVVSVHKDHSAAIWQVKVSPDGKIIATAGADQTIVLREAGTLKKITRLLGHTADIQDLSYSADSRRLASGGTDNTVKIWDIEDIRRKPVLEPSWDPLGFQTQEGALVSVRPDATLQLWHFDKGTVEAVELPTQYPGGLTRSYNGHDYSPTTDTLVLGTGRGDIELWRISTRKRVGSWRAHNRHVGAVRFSSDGQILATGSNAGDVKVWDMSTKELLLQFAAKETGISCVAFSPDSRYLAFSTVRSVYVQALKGRDQATHLPLEGRHGAVTVAFSPDGTLLAASTWGAKALLWEIPSGRLRATLMGHLQGVPGVAFAPDGLTVVTGGHDHRLKFWSLATHQELMEITLEGVHCAHRFSPDGTTLAVSIMNAHGDRAIHLYRAPSWDDITAAEASLE